jgi:hypothetical protein
MEGMQIRVNGMYLSNGSWKLRNFHMSSVVGVPFYILSLLATSMWTPQRKEMREREREIERER